MEDFRLIYSLQTRCMFGAPPVLYPDMQALCAALPAAHLDVPLQEFRAGSVPLYVSISQGWLHTEYRVAMHAHGMHGAVAFRHRNHVEPLLWGVASLKDKPAAVHRFLADLKEECAAVPGLWPALSQHTPSRPDAFVVRFVACMCALELLRHCHLNQTFGRDQ